MLNPNEVHAKHLPPMQAAIMKNRSRLDEVRVGRLYASAARWLQSPDQAAKSNPDPKVIVSRVVATGEKVVIVNCTDEETGLFVQLTGDPARGAAHALMTMGIKYCQETRDSMRQNIATRIW